MVFPKKLVISPELSLPMDAATSTLVVYGGRGSGKTNLAGVLAEEMSKTGIRFAVIDPVGVWWGLRHDGDGKGPGIDVTILGGRHGDLPLKPESGSLIADLVVDEHDNVIIDISRNADGTMWTIGERIKFVTAYIKRIYQRQGEKRRPIHQIIDEAARFAPQIIRQGQLDVAECMGAVAVLVEEGRNVGLGVTLVTQRSARLNKDVAELADCMIAFRILGPNSRRAVIDWLGENVEKERVKEIDHDLRKLPVGSALVVSPGWLEFEGIVPMRKRTTFDSSATPKAGQKSHVPKEGRKPDLAKYRERMSEIVEQVKANDPKELKKQLAELTTKNKQLMTQLERAAAKPAVSEAVTKEKVVAGKQLKRIEALIDRGDKLVKRWDDVSADAFTALDGVRSQVSTSFLELGSVLKTLRGSIVSSIAVENNATREAKQLVPARPSARPPRMPRLAGAPKVTSANSMLTGPQRALVSTLAWWAAMGHESPTRSQIAGKAGWKARGSNLRNRLTELSTMGLVWYPASGVVSLTSEGVKEASFTPPDTNESLHDSIRGALTGPQRVLFETLLTVATVERDRLADLVGWERGGSNLRNRLTELSAMEIVEYPSRGSVKLQDWVIA